jgi:aminoglycoside/choline kinase family phosphotransferase
MGITPEEFNRLRTSAFAKIRKAMRERGLDAPDTDEGLLLLMDRLGVGERLRELRSREIPTP